MIRSTALHNYRLHTITFIVIRSTALQNYRLHTIKKKRITVIAVHTLTNYQMNGTSVLIITYNLLDLASDYRQHSLDTQPSLLIF